MKTSRSLLYGYSKLFGFIILFAMGTLVGTAVTAEEPPTIADLAVSLTSVPHIATAEQKEDVTSTPRPGEHSETSSSNTPGSNNTMVAPKLPETPEKPRQAEEETEMTPIPAQDILDKMTTSAAVHSPPTIKDKEGEFDCEDYGFILNASSSGNNYIIIITILAGAFCILCLLVCY